MNKNINDQIWVLNDNNVEKKYIYQLLGQAKVIGKQCNRDVVLISIGDKIEDYSEYGKKGADIILNVEVNDSRTEIYPHAFAHVVKNCVPFLVMVTTNENSRVIMARICTELKLGFVAGCIKMKYRPEDDRIIFTRTAIESTTEVDILISSQTQVCTVKKNIYSELETPTNQTPIVETIKYEDDNINVSEEIIKLLKVEKNESYHKNNVEDAEVVFGVGRGAIDSLNEIREIAKYCNATIGCTRAMVDEGYINKQFQIGQSGKSIKAKLYVAFGISGASQHIMGILNANKIISITKDENAPILKYSDYAYIVDVKDACKKILDAIIN